MNVKGQPTNIYDALVQALGILSEKGQKANLTHLKPTMIELMDGFDEQEYKDGKGRPFMRFKDFIMEAKRRGVVDVVTRGTSIEVFVSKNSKNVSNTRPDRDNSEDRAKIVKEPKESFSESRTNERGPERGEKRGPRPFLFLFFI